MLRRPDKPGNVSVLGERRFGKSSFLNQIYGALAAEPDLVSIQATTQDWSGADPDHFSPGCTVPSWMHWLGPGTSEKATRARSRTTRDCGILSGDSPGRGCASCCCWTSWNASPAARHSMPFCGTRSARPGHADCRFGYLIANRRPLKELCRDQRIEEPFTGRHPALIQQVLSYRWRVWPDENPDRIDRDIRKYLEDLWSECSEDERWVLLQATSNQDLVKARSRKIYARVA